MNPCRVTSNESKYVFGEKKSKLTLYNSREVATTKVIVDGCEIKDGLRCDYWLYTDEVDIFIELKGQDLQHAFRQIESSIRLLSRNSVEMERTAYVICTRSHMSSTEIQNEQKKFRKKQTRLIVKSSPWEDEY